MVKSNGQLAKMVDKLFEVATRSYEHQVTVLAASVTKVLDGNPDRLSFILSNPGANNVYVKFDRDVAVANGILLVPSGGYISMTWDEDFNVVGWSMYGIAQTANVTINVLEVIAQ